MTMRTPFQARGHFCPFRPSGNACIADDCIAWRWEPLLISEPGYKDALVKAQALSKTDRGGVTAAEYVNANRAKYGLPVKPYQGWCGAAGKPEVRRFP